MEHGFAAVAQKKAISARALGLAGDNEMVPVIVRSLIETIKTRLSQLMIRRSLRMKNFVWADGCPLRRLVVLRD